jgi:hypothetical protein
VHALAKECQAASITMLQALQDSGTYVKSASAVVAEEHANRMRQRFGIAVPSAPAPPPTAPANGAFRPPAEDVVELQMLWTRLCIAEPDPNTRIPGLAQRAGIPVRDVGRVKRVRNQCSHTGDHADWPTNYEFTVALMTARELSRRLNL